MTKQKNKSDCCVAAVANACGVSYKHVRQMLGRDSIKGGLWPHELEWLLDQYGTWHTVWPRRWPVIGDWLKRNKRGTFVVVFRCDISEDGYASHAVACINSEIIGHYKEHWPISNYYRLEEPCQST